MKNLDSRLRGNDKSRPYDVLKNFWDMILGAKRLKRFKKKTAHDVLFQAIWKRL
jgi:hypothetical protein